MSIPKVFISYSHDNLEHKKWVNKLGTRLRNNGIDAILDQWELQPGDDLPHFMETHLASADKVVMVCTERYIDKANSGEGGVGYEKMIITANLLSQINENKIIPVIRQHGGTKTPTFLKSKLFINFSQSEDYEYAFDELIRTIHQSPLLKKPEIGNNPFQENEPELIERKSNDSILELMKIVVMDYENGSSKTLFNNLLVELKISRILLELLINEAEDQGFIEQYATRNVFITEKGKKYALENNLV